MESMAPLVAAMAANDGVIGRSAALAAGMTDARLRSLVRSGLFRRVQPGVLVVAGVQPSRRREWRCCLVAHGVSALSHHSAAAVHRFRYVTRARKVHMIGPFTSSARSAIAVLHRSRRIPPIDIATVDGMRVTTPERTIVDLAATLSAARLERVLDAALADRVVDLGKLVAVFNRLAGRGRRGTVKLRKLLHARRGGEAVVESELERRFERLIRDYGLPQPLRQLSVHREGRLVGRVDFAWRDESVIVEVDGRAGHQQVADFERDRVRDANAAAEGWFPLRFTWRQVAEQPEVVAAAVREALSRRR